MADCFITRRGGGGAGLNFEVVGGTTQPTNPKENTIWVNTDTDITDWVFSSEQPTSSVAGMVWLSIGQTSTTSFNALKKNTLMVYPLFAQQYIGGVWEDVGVQVFQNGSWETLWDGGLFDNGNQYESITGGWYQYLQDGFGGSVNIGDVISMSVPSGITAAAATRNKISLNGYKSLEIHITSISEAGNIIVSETNKGYIVTDYIARKDFTSTGWHSLDVSSLDGEYYIYFTIGNDKRITADQIRLVK